MTCLPLLSSFVGIGAGTRAAAELEAVLLLRPLFRIPALLARFFREEAGAAA